MNKLVLGVVLLLCGHFAACQRVDEAAIAEVDGRPIRVRDFEKFAGKEYFQQRENLYKIQKQKLDDLIGATLLSNEAYRRGLSAESLLEQEVSSKVSPVSAGEIETFYNTHKGRLGLPLEKVSDQIRDFLREQKLQDSRHSFIEMLRRKAKISTHLAPPAHFRVNVSVNGAPAKGSEAAAVTLVKFEDFQCPFCRTVQPRFTELLKKYDGKLRIVHKDLPLDALHPQARAAAEAARCAAEQGKFWQYHDKLYENSPKLSVEDMVGYAKEVSLNAESFDRCLTGGKFKAAVQKDLSEGTQLGLTGTPSFFINGRELSGAQPLEAFTAIIDEELALAK